MFQKLLIFLTLISAYSSSCFALESAPCAELLSILYYPQYPGHPSYADVKLRAGDIVYSHIRRPGTYAGIVGLADGSNQRHSFVEFPISNRPEDIEACKRSFGAGRTCSQAVTLPLQDLGLLPKKNPLLLLPSTMALYLYVRSLPGPKELRPFTVGRPRYLTGDGIRFDVFTALAPMISLLGLAYGIHTYDSPAFLQAASSVGGFFLTALGTLNTSISLRILMEMREADRIRRQEAMLKTAGNTSFQEVPN